MPSKLTAATFLQVVRQSGLVEDDQLQALEDQRSGPAQSDSDAQAWAQELVERDLLTEWQAAKLLQGKHRGFILGNYRLLTLLGKGGMSSVYLAEHRLMRRRCALKVLPTKHVNSASYLARFHREAQAVASLDHPNIVRAYDVSQQKDQDSEIHFLVMEYVAGQSLHELVASCGPFSAEDTADYLRQAAEGLEHAHRAGIVHRDVKPGNLLVDGTGTVKILDLGLARFFHEALDDHLTLDHDEKVLGTADFLAPEQALDSHTADHRADVYSLGCTGYFLLTGHPPFTEGTLTQRLLAHQNKTPPPLREVRPDIPESMVVIIERMMAKRPVDRFQTAGELADVLSEWLHENSSRGWRGRHGEPQDVDRDGADYQLGPPLHKRRRVTDSQPTLVVSSSDTDSTGVDGQRTPPVPPSSVLPLATSDASQPTTTPVEPSARHDFAEPLNGGQTAGSEADELPDFLRPQGTFVEPRGPKHEEALPVFEFDGPADGTSALVDSDQEPQGSSALSTLTPLPRRARRKQKSRKVVATLAVLGAVLAGLAFVVVGNNDATDPRAEGPAARSVISAENSGEAVAPRDTERPTRGAEAPLKWSMTVGPNGDFPDLEPALSYVKQNRQRFEAQAGRRSRIRIELASGTYLPQRIVIDNSAKKTFPDGLQLVCTQPPWAQVEGDAEHPAVEVKDIANFLLEGIQVRGNGAQAAIKLAGHLDGSQFRNLNIDGFTRHGILAEAASGALGAELVFEQITCRSDEPESVGLRFQSGDSTTGRVRIQNCRLLGEGVAGLQFDGGASYVAIVQNIMAEYREGIQFVGDAVTLRNVIVGNNTFFHLDRGIVMSSIPSGMSHQLSFYRNLFASLTGPELIIAQNYELNTFVQMLSTDGTGIRRNWSDRVSSSDTENGEHELVIPPEGERVSDFAFASTDPSEAGYLKPSPASRFVVNDPRSGGELRQPFIGAVAP